MSSSRQAILDRLQRSLAAHRLALPAAPPPAATEFTPSSPADLVPRLGAAFDRLGVTWEVAETPVVARLKLITQLQERGVERLLAWAADQLPVAGVVEALNVLGIETMTPVLAPSPSRASRQHDEQRTAALAALEPIDIGLTGADAAFADTGALALAAGAGRPRLVSTLPRRHIVLLPESKIVASQAVWLATLQRGPAYLNLIAGPGQARDIELTPAIGVHGPRRLHVVVVREI